MAGRSEAPHEGPRSDIVTTIAVAIAAHALDDLVHEVVGTDCRALVPDASPSR
jgi:hypothetical protein